MSYIKDNFLLCNKTAEKLYFNHAVNMPIFDYHCHLPEKQILEDLPFNDVFEIWLKGDHYKWRLMRNYGVDEELITGNSTNKEKFITYCTVLGTAFGNPLYHWSQVELKEFFNCELEINAENAEQIWDWCNEYIRLNNITPSSLRRLSNRLNCVAVFIYAPRSDRATNSPYSSVSLQCLPSTMTKRTGSGRSMGCAKTNFRSQDTL